ncbi:MAG TPA: response regulator [Bryobacteraceae bacterium]|nr:response regulator [Bryobacteraceae bacterium]
MKTEATCAARILLVDENLRGSRTRKLILEGVGYSVETALSGEEAWDLFQKTRFDVVVTDFRMSGMDGVKLIQLLRSVESPVRIVMLSGFVNCLGLSQENTGADEVIAKSNKEVPELLRAVKKLSQQPPPRRAGSVRRASSLKTSRAV